MGSPNWIRAVGALLAVSLSLSVVLNGAPASPSQVLLRAGAIALAVGVALPGIVERVPYYRWISLGAAGVGGLLTLVEESTGPVEAGINFGGGAIIAVVGIALLHLIERETAPD